jgi:hypothetical protein
MCPVGWQGQYRGKDRKACIRMEVICDDFLRIWHCMFGAPGSNNDIQIFEQSTHFNLMRSGRWPEIKPVIEIAGQQFDWFYYLCDGIYPRVRYLMSSSTDKEEKSVMFASHQEGARKSVERVFAVLFKRFRILDIPSRLWMAEDMGCILKCCVILHNMVADARKQKYTGTRTVQLETPSFSGRDTGRFTNAHEVPEGRLQQAAYWTAHESAMESRMENCRLKCALIEHIWERRMEMGGGYILEGEDVGEELRG